MLEFCPLCHKNGYKRKITLWQINLQEAVWLCEYSKCPWPFGYQDFTFVPRRVGETWSSEWELSKPPVPKSTEPLPVSLNELGLDTPPVTPGSGCEVIHKDSVFKDGACSVTSLNSNANTTAQATLGIGSSKNGSNRLKRCIAGESVSIDTESTRSEVNEPTPSLTQGSRMTKINGDLKSQELLSSINRSHRDEKTPVAIKGDFSLTNDVNLESLDKCLSASQGFINACDDAEAATHSVFNVGKSSKEILSMHESRVKCKKWLNNNTKDKVVDHCSLSTKSEKVLDEFKNVLSERLCDTLEKSSPNNLDNIKQCPRIRSIEKTNIKLAKAIATSNQSIEQKNKTSSIAVESPTVVYDSTDIVKDESEQNMTNTHSIACITVGEKISNTCKIENRTLAIDGLEPINISYEVPNFVEESIIVPLSTISKDEVKNEIVKLDSELEPVVENSVIAIDVKVKAVNCAESKDSLPAIGSKTETQRQSIKKPLKRASSKVAKYQGFNFGTLRKKSKINGEENIKSSPLNIPSPENVSSCSDLTWTSELSCATTITCDSKSGSVISGIYSQSKSNLGIENCNSIPSSSDLKSSNACSPTNYGLSNFNLDQVLDDLILSNNDDSTKSVGDDWLVSLFD